jgi:Cd2+/Zn2+-exporting ATPase
MTMKKAMTLPITGLDCIDCARTLEGGLAQLEGVQSANLSFAASSLAVEYDPQRAGLASIVARIRELGYDVAAGEDLAFRVDGLDCADCAARLEKAITSLPGVLEARVVFTTAQMRVRGIAGHDFRDDVAKRAAELGYSARLESPPAETGSDVTQSWWTSLYKRRRTVLTFVSGAFLAIAFLLRTLGGTEPAATIAYALAILSGGSYVARSGWAALRTTHSLDMNVLMTIAAIGAMAIGEWDEGATAMFLFSLGNALEALTMDRARQTLRKLIELSPKEATRVHGEHADRVPVEHLKVGDLIEVKPGANVPMDGIVEQGSSTVNQAPITGESMPVTAHPGSPVYAGSINGDGALFVRVTKLARDNTLSRIVQMVQDAQASRAPAQRFVDTFAKYYTPAVIALAAGIAIVPPLAFGGAFRVWFYRALVLLVISCPCALVISTPVAIVSAISNAARHGILIKGGTHLEAVGRVRAVAFDKTGTLTKGHPALTDIELADSGAPFGGSTPLTADDLLSLAASIETHSQHPIAQAIVDEARRRGLSFPLVKDYTELIGHGAQARIDGQRFYVGSHNLFAQRVPHAEEICQRADQLEAQGKTTVLVGNEREVFGLIAVADPVREASAGAVRALRESGIQQMALLSGDNERTAAAIAKTLNIDDVQANLLPQDKVGAVEKLLTEHGSVVMIGDGVNDAPALARATVGIAMGAAGSDAALETADIVLMSDDLQRIPYVIRLGRRTLETIKANITLSLAIKGLFLLLAVAGSATLWMAVFADMGTSLIVTLNGMRLLRDGRP